MNACCPFCASDRLSPRRNKAAEFYLMDDDERNPHTKEQLDAALKAGRVWIRCNDCGAQGPSVPLHNAATTTLITIAFHKWNNRADPT